MTAYYNENDPYCVEWLKNLIAADLIAPGDVDPRSILDVKPYELAGYDQCHFFAGLGGWGRALRLADWSDHRQVWTGSCPCQPFSTAGKRVGFADERHLWPFWFHLIAQCRPAVVFGEQVARAKIWLDQVFSDLETLDYACGAAIIPAASVDAPHIRDRLWFVAYASGAELWEQPGRSSGANWSGSSQLGEHGATRAVADANLNNEQRRPSVVQMGRGCVESQIAHNGDTRRTQWPAEPDVGRVAYGVPARVAKLRALGNAIVPQVAAEFIKASRECHADT